MPAALTYPGVYVEEIPSGVRTIIGVATSIAAFVGRTARGPVQEPATITSYADFERRFGPLSRDYPLGYAVRDFYLNGGTTAIILRLYKKSGQAEGVSTSAFDGLTLRALSQGKWGDKIGVKIEAAQGVTEDFADAIDPSLAAADFFNLIVTYGLATNIVETYLAVTLKTKGGARRLDRVLAAGSNYIGVSGAVPDVTAPGAGAHTFTGGDDGGDLDQASFQLQKD
ncbi:MAG TPA: phage tail sheath family protein, partial [Thermoanaerobaculia bacterium]|nr:phage tail sheath family protein [Thermoanaerobaculia bacterium]